MNTQDHAIGSRCWATADGYIPAWSSGPEPEMVSHEALCFLNIGTREAHVRVTILFSDRDPAGPYLIEVPSRRTKHVRINNLKDPEPIPHGIDLRRGDRI